MSKEHPQPPTYEQLVQRRDVLTRDLGSKRNSLGRIGQEGTNNPLHSSPEADLKIMKVTPHLTRFISMREETITGINGTLAAMDAEAESKAREYKDGLTIHESYLAKMKQIVVDSTRHILEYHEAEHQKKLAQPEQDPELKRGLALLAQRETEDQKDKEAAEKPKAVPTPIGSIKDFQEPKKVETKAKKEPLVERVLPNGHTITLGYTEVKIFDLLPDTRRRAVDLIKAIFGDAIKTGETTVKKASWRVANSLQSLRPKLSEEGYNIVTVLPEKGKKDKRGRYYLTSVSTEKKPKDKTPRNPRPARPTPEAKPFQLAEGVTVTGLRPKEEEILLHIQCYPDKTSKEQIAQAVWPNTPLEKALKNLSTNLANLRAKIKPAEYYVNLVEGNYLLETSQRFVKIKPEKKPGIPQEPTPVAPADVTPAVSPASSDTLSGEEKKI